MHRAHILFLAFFLGSCVDPQAPVSEDVPFLTAPNQVEAVFSPTGVTFSPLHNAWQVSFGTTSLGRVHLTPLDVVAPQQLREDRIEIDRGQGITEWFEVEERGTKHGFELERRPDGGGPLTLDIPISTMLLPIDTGTGIWFVDTDGVHRATYDGLVVFDSNGLTVPSDLALTCEQECAIQIHIDDRNATYPLSVDPLFWLEEAVLHASDSQTGDRLGFSVALSGSTAVVGAHLENHTNPNPLPNLGGTNIGAAYVYVRSGTTWTQQAKIVASDGNLFANNDRFGQTAAIDGDTIVIGAPKADLSGTLTDSGKVYIFTRTGTTWSEQAVFTAADVGVNDRFGNSVTISNNTVVVGAHSHDTPFTNGGAAYIFDRAGTTWSQTQKIASIDLANADHFGRSVSIAGDYIAIGATGEDNPNGSGTTYIFKRIAGTWSQTAKLKAADNDILDRFGSSVSISGNTLAVGAKLDDQGGSNAGAAYIFNRDPSSATPELWTQTTKLVGSSSFADEGVGRSISVSGDIVVAGAPTIGTGQSGQSGAAYVWRLEGGSWVENAKVVGSTSGAGDRFGGSVSAAGTRIIIGGERNDDLHNNAGAAYVFVGETNDNDLDGYCKDPALNPIACAPAVDCDDHNPLIHPGATEVVDNGVDESCDGHDAPCFPGQGCTIDVVVTEIMATPHSAASASLGEWLEVQNNSGTPVDLRGLTISTNAGVSALPEFTVLSPGEVGLFAKTNDGGANGGLDPSVIDALWTGTLDGTADTVQLCDDTACTAPYDIVSYDSGYSSGSSVPVGGSLSLDPSTIDSTLNDTARNWCDGRSSFGDGDFGTPGFSNEACDFDFDYNFQYTDSTGTNTPINASTTASVRTADAPNNPSARSFFTGNSGEGEASITTTAAGQTLVLRYFYQDGMGGYSPGITYTSTRPFGTDCWLSGVMSTFPAGSGYDSGTFSLTDHGGGVFCY